MPGRFVHLLSLASLAAIWSLLSPGTASAGCYSCGCAPAVSYTYVAPCVVDAPHVYVDWRRYRYVGRYYPPYPYYPPYAYYGAFPYIGDYQYHRYQPRHRHYGKRHRPRAAHNPYLNFRADRHYRISPKFIHVRHPRV
jgi:hypothetical protein